MKIVHLITRLILGGAQENTLITCRELARRGHDVTLITGPAIGPEGELFYQAKKDNYDVIVVDEMIRAINPVKDFIAYKKIKKLLRDLRPDVVHTHSAKAGILGRFAGYKMKGFLDNPNRPIVVHTIHGLAFHSYQNELINKFYIAVEKAAAKHTDAFISVAKAMTDQALSVGIGSAEMFTTAYSAIEEQDFLREIPQDQKLAFRDKHGLPADAVVMVTIARLFKLKGHKYIIESAKSLAQRYDNAYWLFVGNGNLAEELRKQISQLGLEGRIRFTGLLDPKNIPLAIQSSDILVHCSLREGLARALPQGFLCGKPVVSFDVDGAKEVLNENTGYLVKPKDLAGLTDACAELIESEKLRHQLGQTGREFVKERFAPETMVDTIERVYTSLLETS